MVVNCRMKDEAAVWLACGYFVECARTEFVREFRCLKSITIAL